MAHSPRIRIGDRERDDVAEALRVAAGEGRLEPDELDERLEAAYAAKFHDDLVPLLDDLPSRFRPPAATMLPDASDVRPPLTPAQWFGGYQRGTSALFTHVERKGPWGMAGHHQATAIGGRIILDLRDARFPSQFVRISATNLFGTIDVVVHPATAVAVQSSAVTFAPEEARPEIDRASPVVTIRGTAVGGEIVVHRRRSGA